MTSNDFYTSEHLQADIVELVKKLPKLKNRKYIEQALNTLLRLSQEEEIDRLDWKILSSSLADMERGFQLFHTYRHVRKVTIFGSARLSPDTPDYKMARDFGRCVAELGFMVITGGGGGIMHADMKVPEEKIPLV